MVSFTELDGATYLPDLEIEVKREGGWFAVEGGKEGEEKGSNFMHLLQVGRVLDGPGPAGEQALAHLLPRHLRTLTAFISRKSYLWQTHLAQVEVEVNAFPHLRNILIRELHPLQGAMLQIPFLGHCLPRPHCKGTAH